MTRLRKDIQKTTSVTSKVKRHPKNSGRKNLKQSRKSRLSLRK
jgi:hypothetical protein